jgi:tetratricopeptide (TPR) repeat protein
MVKHNTRVFWGVLIITAFVFSGSLRLGWTNWDDDRLVYENPQVTEGRFQDIFTKPAAYNTFNPLPVASFALEWKLVQDKPFLYHFNNYLLHLLSTALVWLLFRQLGLSIWWSAFGALLFGIHPMRVESVAWITERKDGLFACFYLASLLAYLRYMACEKMFYLSLTFMLFVLSFLSKGQAVALPFTLILLDWYFKRRMSARVILEKVVFFSVSLVIALLTVTFFVKDLYSAADKRTIMNVFNLFEQTILAGYAYTIYLLKSLIPYAVAPLYPMPGSLQIQHWLGAVLALCVFAGSLLMCRRYRYITFGLLFYTFNIFFLLMPFRMSETAYLFDHYSYLAYTGLFFTIAMFMQCRAQRWPSYRTLTAAIAVMLLATYAVLTIQYIPAWKNSETLWNYAIKKYPGQLAVAHLNRGHYWYKNRYDHKALADFNAAIEINPGNPRAFMNRSILYLARGENGKALDDINRYLDLVGPFDTGGFFLDSRISDALGNRGLIYFRTGQYQKALPDLDLAIKLNPSNPTNYLNRALVYKKLGYPENAQRDMKVLEQMGIVVGPALRESFE